MSYGVFNFRLENSVQISHFHGLFTEFVEQMALNMRTKEEISPTLRTIVNRFDEENRRPSDFHSSGQNSEEDAAFNEAEFDGGPIEDCVSWSYDHDEETIMVDEGPYCADSSFPDYHEVSVTVNPQ